MMTEFKQELYMKIQQPVVVTEVGMVTAVRELQLPNIQSLNVLNEVGMVTEIKEVQY